MVCCQVAKGFWSGGEGEGTDMGDGEDDCDM
jgi:hypothetical protein